MECAILLQMTHPPQRGENMAWVNRNNKIPKSMMDLCILDILEDTNEQETLTQGDIRSRLEARYGIKVDRKTLGRHLGDLTECISGIRYQEQSKTVEGEELVNKTAFWLEKDDTFDETELLALIYSVMFSRHMPTRAKRDLVRKLDGLSSSPMHHDAKNYLAQNCRSVKDYNQLFWNLEVLNQAIEDKQQVSFQLSTLDEKGRVVTPKMRTRVYPRGIGHGNGDFYLIATSVEQGVDLEEATASELRKLFHKDIETVQKSLNAKQPYLESYRLDRIRNIEIVSDEKDDLTRELDPSVTDNETMNFDIRHYAKLNPLLFDGFQIQATMSIPRGDHEAISDLYDFFGTDCVAEAQIDSRFPYFKDRQFMQVYGNNNAILDYVLRHRECVDILLPEELSLKYFEAVDAAHNRALAFFAALALDEGAPEEEVKAELMEHLNSKLDEILEGLRRSE